jgi:hypothetical protein
MPPYWTDGRNSGREAQQNSEAAVTERKLSRQRLAQIRAGAEGLCAQFCGRPKRPGRVLCRACALKDTVRHRERHGFKPWQPGGMGRPPLPAEEEKVS